eukprot:8439088-Pyramimonas_sp.AAC.1
MPMRVAYMRRDVEGGEEDAEENENLQEEDQEDGPRRALWGYWGLLGAMAQKRGCTQRGSSPQGPK